MAHGFDRFPCCCPSREGKRQFLTHLSALPFADNALLRLAVVRFLYDFMLKEEKAMAVTSSADSANTNSLGRNLFGRRVIYSPEAEITPENVSAIVEQAYITHLINRDEIEYLWKYYKGDQPVLYRIREVRNNLTKHIVENRANQIVSFKVGYLAGKPLQYIASDSDERVTDAVKSLNDVMRMLGKYTKDKELIEWAMICGVGYRYVVQNNDPMIRSPFNIFTLDPRDTFVIRANDYTKRILAGVNYVTDPNQNITFTVYTDDSIYTIVHGSGKYSRQVNHFGRVPIIEYKANTARMGCFELVLPLINAINDFDSARNEAVEAFVQSLLVLYNCQVEEGTTADDIRAAGMILLKSIGDAKADVKVIAEQLNQTQNQTLKDDMWNSVLQIVGMPSQGTGSTGDSSNNGAIILKNGWQGAETRATDFEAEFSLPEMEMLRIVSVLCDGYRNSGISFDPADLVVKFTRRNYEDILSKSQTLTTMLGNDKIHPQKAYEASGLFVDTEEAYQMGMEWFNSHQPQEQKSPVVVE